MMTRSPRLVRDFLRHEKGVAAVEFALILPLLLTLYLGSIEASSLFTVDRRVDVISTTVADLVSRWNPSTGTISTAELGDYFRAAEGIIVPFSTTGLKQVVSVLQVAANGTAKVVWSCGHNGATPLLTNSDYTLGARMQEIARGGYLVAATTSYSYKPVLGMVFTEALNLEKEALFLPRFGKAIAAPASGCPS